MTASRAQTHFIAFYSYKGGVGRTLALANCARALAARGRTVAIIDLDLEAPGLEAFDTFRPASEASVSKGDKGDKSAKDDPRPPLAGFAEYIADCRKSGPPPSLESYVHRCKGEPGDKGVVYLMPAGKRGEAAYRDILVFDWDRFYRDENGYRIMENLRGHIAHDLGGEEGSPIKPDYVLIDSRTGLSETGGIATHQLADLVVMLFSLNRQNLEGMRGVHDSLAKLPNPPQMLLVASPFPDLGDAEKTKGTVLHRRLEFVRRHLDRAVNAAQPERIPYRPVLSLEERIAVDKEDDRRSDLHLPYTRLLDLILKTLDAPDIYLDDAMRAWRSNDLDEALKKLESGLAVHPDSQALQDALRSLGGGLRINLTHLPAGAEHFLGREAELAALDDAWESNDKTAIVELIAPGGVGKTALVKRWLDGMRQDGWRDARRVFAWSFYSQGTSDERQSSEDHFFAEALKWFGVEVEAALDARDKGRRLAQAVAAHRTLLILDGLEPLQYPPGPLAGELRAPGLKALLSHLATANHDALCVLTSREWLKDLNQWLHGPVRRIDLGNLSDQDGARLLHASGVVRAGAAPIGEDDAELIAASREVKGHALTLTLLSSYLALGFEGDIRQRDHVDFKDADQQTTGGHAFRVIAGYEHWFASQGEQGAAELTALRLLGFFDRPASRASLDALCAAPTIAGLTEALQGLSAPRWNATLKRLADCRLLEADVKTGGLDAYPLVREYFADRLAQGMPKAWREGHRRLYEQLKRNTPYRPDTLEGLQPLYQAVVHGCKAGLYQEAYNEVYFDRILRGAGYDGFYSTRMLGAIGADLRAVACFFVEPWRRLAPTLAEGHQSWLLNEAASRLRALGRLTEALEPMRVGVEMRVKQHDWDNAADSYDNLSQLQLGLGRVAAAVADAGQAVVYADRSGDAFCCIASRTTLADARHQQGQHEAARADFVAAEREQARSQPDYPLLYSLRGFQYCDLLLVEAERGAWDGREDAGLAGVCGDVSKRAAQTLAWATPQNWLLDIALDHLTLARCALYADILQGRPPGVTARQETEAAVAGLRAAGDQDMIPKGLLTRAWLRHRLNDPDAAEADLTEAQQIAERGEMKLHLADIHLTRARLFQDKEELAKARTLIEECGYGRRLPELEDAEAAAQSWPATQPTVTAKDLHHATHQ